MTWLTTEPKCVNTKIQATAAILGQVTKINAKLGETNYQLDCRGKEKNARQNYTWNFNEDPILAGRSYIQKPKGVLTISNVKAEHQGVYTCLINKLRQGKYVGIASTKKFMLGIIGLKDGDGMKVVDPAKMVTIPPQRMSTLKLTMVTSVKSVGGGGGKSEGNGYLQVTKVRANIFTLQFHAYIFHCKQVQDGSSGRVTQHGTTPFKVKKREEVSIKRTHLRVIN